ncbi:hypothetical protein MMC30_007128 [Trapelia coarctata]|nr:hypothetical protein [Trapelia coarctata]
MPDLAPLKSPNAANRLVSLQNLCTLLPDLVNNILHLYVRAATFTADQLPQVAFSESTIRFAKLMAVIEKSHGTLDDAGLQAMVLNVENNSNTSLIPSQLAAFPSKADIAAVLLRALPTPAMDRLLDMKDRINILAGISSVLAKLGYHRKKAFILRELMIALLPALIQSRKDNAAEMGVHPAASLSSFDHISNIMDFEEIFGGNERSESGIQIFLTTMCEVYGVVLSPNPGLERIKLVVSDGDAPRPEDAEPISLDDSNSVANRAVNEALIRSFGDLGLKIDVLRSCINTCEALPDLRGVLRFSSALLKTVGSGVAPGSEGGDVPALPVEDQSRLFNSISRTTTAAKKLGLDDSEAEYWDEFLVRDIEVTRASSLMSPVSRGKSQLYATLPEGAQAKEGPFIYNPFVAKPSSAAAEPLLIAGEEAVFTVLCQNLYEFDMEIEWIKLDTTEVVVNYLAKNITIGPLRTHSVNIAGIPKSPGVLKIGGCIAKVKGCREKRFPIFRSQWKGLRETKVKTFCLPMAATTAERPVSTTSTSEQLTSQRLPSTKAPVAVAFAINVIESQPNMVVKAVSLSQSAIMLLEGEVQRFNITLCNVSSSTPVDLLLLTFNDSTSAILQSALSNKDLSPAEHYEVELASYRKEAFRWRRQTKDPEPVIAPGGELTLEIEVVGKPGLTYGAIFIDYGYLGVPKSQIKDNFYTRQVHIPITVTVNASVQLARNDFLPFTGDFAWLNQQRQLLGSNNSQRPSSDKRPRAPSRVSTAPQSRFQPLLERLGLGTQGSEHCLLLLDFHNAWPNPLSISVQVRERTTPQDPSLSDLWKRAYTVHELIQPGHTSRLVLLLPRIALSNPHAPIPSLRPSTKRQFILSTNKAYDHDSERSAREAFWLREEVLKLMRASWTEDATGRTGDIELRPLRLSPRMIDAIKLEEVGIELSISSDSSPSSSLSSSTASDDPTVRQLARSSFLVPTSAFLTLTTTLTNRLSHPITPLLRLQPSLRHQSYNVALDLGKKFAFNGALQQVLPTLAPGESKDVRMGVVWLCKGDFEIRACVEELKVWKGGEEKEGSADRGRKEEVGVDLEGLAERTERIVWWGREVCLVDVVDGGGRCDGLEAIGVFV